MSGSCPVGATVCRDAHAEVDRLRAGIKALILEYEDPEDDGMREPEYYWGLAVASDDLTTLLNPNEGEAP